MPDLERLQRVLADHEKRIVKLESQADPGRRNVKSVAPTQKKKYLSDYILDPRDQGCFKAARTGSEVHVKLQTTYVCIQNRVDVALGRMARTHKLRRADKVIGEKKYVAFVW